MNTFTTHSSIKYVAFICTLLLLALSLHAFAQENTEVIPAVVPAVVESAPEETTVRGGLKRQIQERMINLISNVTTRLNAGVERMTNIMIRLSTRIEKLKAEGIDTTNAELKLAQANTSLSSARATLESIESAPRAMSGDTPRVKYTTMRAQFLLVRDHLRTTQSQLLEVIAILKGSAVRNVEVDQDTATSSITSDVITN